VDPDLTNSKCSYWHFRLDADTSMKMEALTTFMKDPEVKKVYLINQNYSHGHQVSKYAKECSSASARRADRRRRLRAAGPGARLRALHRQDQAVGRRHRDHRQLGPDLALLVKAANDA
jgi:branched-chain amino acid transport system substrate-binding protein